MRFSCAPAWTTADPHLDSATTFQDRRSSSKRPNGESLNAAASACRQTTTVRISSRQYSNSAKKAAENQRTRTQVASRIAAFSPPRHKGHKETNKLQAV